MTTMTNPMTTFPVLDEDVSQGLTLVSAIGVTNESPFVNKETRGLVYDRDSKLVLKTFPYADEYVGSDVDGVESAVGSLSNYKVYDAYEGTIIRVYNVGGKWNMSTHKKLDAFKSRWSCRTSFGQNFVSALGKETLDEFYARLNPQFKYVFLLINNSENRVVCTVPEGHVMYHVGTFDSEFNIVQDCDLGMLKPTEHTFTSTREMCEFVESLNPLHQMGLICISLNGFRHVKILNTRYKAFSRFRGNTSSIKVRYLEVRTDSNLVTGLMTLFPEYVPMFDAIEKAVQNLSVKLHSVFMRRYINKNKEFVVLPPSEHALLKECFKVRFQRFTPSTVMDVLDKTPAYKLLQIINNETAPDHVSVEPVEGYSPA
jgi:hypothetical protein